MDQRLYSKYNDLAALGFDRRSGEDQARALARPKLSKATQLEATQTTEQVRREATPFHYDQRLITGDFLYRRLGAMGQLAPTFSPGFQNRMTHSQHVAEIAGRLSDRMHLGRTSGAMARAIAYAHDIGHSPFSHEGEHVFNARLNKHGKKWDHDDFGFRLLTEFAHDGFSYYGVPLSNGVLEGLVKRYTRFNQGETNADAFHRSIDDVPTSMRNDQSFDQSLILNQWSPVEGQIAAISDWVAGTVSDTRDLLTMSLNTGTPREFEKYCDHLMGEFPVAKKIWRQVEQDITAIERETPQTGLSKHTYYARMNTKIARFSDALEEFLISDVLEETHTRYQRNKDHIQNAEDIRHIDEGLVSFTPETYRTIERYETFKKESVYPKLLEENANTIALMESFFTIVEDRFKDPSLNTLEIGETWRDLYTAIAQDQTLDKNEQQGRLAELVAEYITCNFTDADVIYFMREIDPQLYEQEITNSKKGIYPRLAHSDTPDSFEARLARDRAAQEQQQTAI